MNSAAAREAQATACLEAAERFQPQLLALATALSGSKEEGMELFQQASLNCHDAIQSGGFQGDGYTFYLRRAIKNLHYRTQKEQQRRVPISFTEPALEEEHEQDWAGTGWGQPLVKLMQPMCQPEPAHDERAALAEQVMSEVRERFTPADRVALRLSLGGMSCQQIAEHIGTKDQSWVWRRLDRMKATLRELFQPAFDALGE
jgi:RNA polymerase sigma factor (sigma-70 family)